MIKILWRIILKCMHHKLIITTTNSNKSYNIKIITPLVKFASLNLIDRIRVLWGHVNNPALAKIRNDNKKFIYNR